LSEKLRISLEAARVNAKLTQSQVCDALGISVSTLIKWEHGERMPDADKATDLANLYGLRLDDINFCRKS
jgi:transcriptional regulator with XRE-family HTH domain